MGDRPEGCTLDRIDTNGNYEPGNCVWSTAKEQSNNKRNNHLIEYKGKIQSLKLWAEELGMHNGTLYSRIVEDEWEIEKAFTTPINYKKRNKVAK